MARRKSAKKSSGGWLRWLFGILLVLVLLVAEYYGLMDEDSGENSPGPRQPAPVAGGWYEVYFTQPGTGTRAPEAQVIASIDSAQERLWVASFDFDLDPVADAMIRAQQRGVDVRLVVDEDNAGLPSVQRLERGRVGVRADDREAFMHNKFIVVDDEAAWFGSMNLTINDLTRNNNNFSLIHSAEFNQDFAQEFEELWAGEFGPTSPDDTPYPRLSTGESNLDIYFSPEDKPRLPIVELLERADSEIRFMVFSFTDEAIAEAIINAERRGVDVAGVFDTFQAAGTSGEYPRLENLGLPVRLDGNSGILHHKVIIVDRRYVVAGSYNFTLSASRSNDEALVILDDPAIAAAFLEEWERIWAQGRE